MISLQRVAFSYGAERVLHDVSLEVGEGELVALIGPSGAGKTTLLRIILGELVPTAGRMVATGANGIAVGYVPQLEAGERGFPLTVEGMVLLGGASTSGRMPWFSRQERSEAMGVLEWLGIANLADSRLSELSGGQFQRALIARALMSRPNLLVLDEPTSGIDMNARQQVLELIEALRDDGLTVLLTTHDLNWVAARMPRIACLNRTIVADGPPDAVLTTDIVSRTFGAAMEVILHDGRPLVVDRPARGAAR